jgi:transposase
MPLVRTPCFALRPDDETAPREKKKRGAHGRKPLPKDLPRIQVEHHPAETTCPGCRREMQRIGEEVTEELDWQPASFLVTEHVRPKYACKHCQEGVLIAELPRRPIEKGRPGRIP